MTPEDRPVKQVIVIRRNVRKEGVRRGKEIAQGAHASMAWLTRRIGQQASKAGYHAIMLSPAERTWLTGSFAKIVVQVPGLDELLEVQEAAEKAGLTAELITDAGRTEFGGALTVTALGIGPDYADLIDPVTRDLRLY
jgi:PTH2 family peptidyl-tRNA hydrolase